MASGSGMVGPGGQQLVQMAVTGLMDTTPEDNLDSSSDHDESDKYEPQLKQRRVDVDFDVHGDASVKQILFNINKAICMRLDNIESCLNGLSNRQREIEQKVDTICSIMKQNSAGGQSNSLKKGAFVVGLPQQNGKGSGEGSESGDGNGPLGSIDSIAGLGPNVTLITLNSEEDYPYGSWMGDENNVEMRVRCPITPSDLLHIHSNCRTPEKMALTLLDYLFDRETQAMSNLSGQGKHGKKQLDPLMIYGIRCHLITKFNISENDWHRIKQNVDSKCRTAFRRRQRGMPLTVKAFRGKSFNNSYSLMGGEMLGSDDDSMNHEDSLHISQNQDVYLQGDLDGTGLVTGEGLHGEVQILHATPEQISQLQHAHHIQILQGDQVIQVPVPSNIQSLSASDLPEGLQVAVSAVSLPGIMSETSPIIQLADTHNTSHADS
ncbi:protein BANP-like [Mya arenaria]|uniref:protein BANP-like n=1 Tax=Mya arenaria TaxID=6604 RepID=UPI0022E2DA6D|nr:protein BANP-like [Mya arenaria]XP_052815074.1 protein BANP-like [Mya arenaria]